MTLQYSALVIFLLGTAGLADHSMLLKTGHIRPGFFCFYTNLSNIWILLYQILLFFAGFSMQGALWRVLTDVRVSTGMALSIWVTHLMYHFVLVPDAKKHGKRFADFGASFGNLCAHYITPALVLAQWLFLQDKAGINLWSAVCWLVLPLLYSVFALLRARTGKPIGHTKLIYPYPFLDLGRLGARRFCLVFLAVLAFFFALGCVLVGVGHLVA